MHVEEHRLAARPGLAAPLETPGPDRGFELAPRLGGVAWLLWAAISIPVVSGAHGNEAESIALLIFIFAVPVATVAGLLELVLTRRRATTALAVLATLTGSLGGLLAGALVIGSMSVPQGTSVGSVFMIEGLSLAIVCIGHVLLASRLLPGPWRLVPFGAALLAILALGPAATQALGPPEPGTWLSRPGSGWATRVGTDERIWTGAVDCHWRRGYEDGVASVGSFDVGVEDGGAIVQVTFDAREGVGSVASLVVALGGGSYTHLPGRLTAVANDGFDGAVESTSTRVILSWTCPE